jgi:uncharacterized protein involved in cysteine biosynthesis
VVANVIAAPFNGLLAARVENWPNPGSAPLAAGRSHWKELLLSPLRN